MTQMDYDTAWKLTGGLSTPSKMPGHGWSLSAKICKAGRKLHEISGSVCEKCYALKGHYVYPVVQNALKRRLLASRKQTFVPAMVYLINCLSERYFRWFDSGDLQDVEMLNKIAEIARLCPHVQFWLPTKEYTIVSNWFKAGNIRPTNLNIRLSGYMIDESGPITLARRLGVTISEVSTGQFTCPASKQGNKCATCRACWDSEIFNIVYKKH